MTAQAPAERKNFFFAKKKQKTLAHSGPWRREPSLRTPLYATLARGVMRDTRMNAASNTSPRLGLSTSPVTIDNSK
jgi:hypothetical protein